MKNPVSIWYEEHAQFTKLLGLLEGQLNLFHRGQTPNYPLLLDIMCYMTHYPDLQHHPREDLAFEIVRERHPKLAKLVDALTAEHVIAVEKSSQLVADLDSVVNGAILPRDKVEMPGREYIAHFRHHMVKEEAELFKLVEQTLTDDDWKAIDAKLKPLVDPLFGTHAKEQYAALRREIASEAGVPADD